jgi:hypothetical protein
MRSALRQLGSLATSPSLRTAAMSLQWHQAHVKQPSGVLPGPVDLRINLHADNWLTCDRWNRMLSWESLHCQLWNTKATRPLSTHFFFAYKQVEICTLHLTNMSQPLIITTHWKFNILFQISSERLALSKGPDRVGVSLPSPEDRHISSFQKVVFF